LYLVYNTIAVEQLHKPAIVIYNKGFSHDAHSAAANKGLPLLRGVPIDIPPECSVKETIQAGTNAVMDHIFAALTQPLTEEEKSPKPKIIEKTSRMVFKGSLEEVNRFFYKRGWTDGLPIIPPTEEAVNEMLKGTDLPADHLVGKIESRRGKATVEKIAINALMAGALPTYMPVLIAGVKCMLDPDSEYGTCAFSTSSRSPFFIINGPIRKELNVNSGVGALSPGQISNATIGRAMSLITKNIGGVRPGLEDMGSLGNPAKYSMVIAEDEEGSPWEPLHVERGFDKEDSAVTLYYPNSYIGQKTYSTDSKGVLNTVIFNTPPGRGTLCLIIPATAAKWLGDDGWTKEEVKKYIMEYARVPAYKKQYIKITPKLLKPFNETDLVPIFPYYHQLMVIVAGGVHPRIGLVLGTGAEPTPCFATHKVELPANWESLVKKYADIVPKYIK
jgi:hypothetical protein